jgi:sigma-B regulation protein RsbU (phosphoserine phosphatase)
MATLNSSQASRRKIRRLQTLVKASELLNSSLDLDRILEVLVEHTTKNLNAATGTIYLLEKERKELWARTIMAKKKVEIRLPVGQGIAGYVAQTGKTIRITDAYKDRRFYRDIDKRSGFKTKTMLCMPMKDRMGRINGVFQILNKRKGVFTKDDEQFLRAVSIPATIAIENARLHVAEVESQKVQRELDLAASIQQQILPKSMPTPVGAQMTAVTRPCRAVGGDFYDVIEIDEDRIALAIADVSGKGVAAALMVSTFQAALHTYIEFGLPLAEIASKLNSTIHEHSTVESFITCVLCIYNTKTGILQYVNAGHNFPIVFRPAGGFMQLESGAIGLGMAPGIRYEEEQIHLDHGELLLLYTDGVTEAMNKSQDLYSEARLCTLVSKLLSRDVREIEDNVFKDVESFSTGVKQVDDLTLLLLKVK